MRLASRAAAVALTLALTAPAALAQGNSGAGASGQRAQGGTSLGSVQISHRVKAGGETLAPGTYQVRLTNDEPSPAVGQTPQSERFVELLRGGRVVAREVATVVSNADVAAIVKGPKPANGGTRVEMLKGNEYVRVWINRGGNNYLLHLPPA